MIWKYSWVRCEDNPHTSIDHKNESLVRVCSEAIIARWLIRYDSIVPSHGFYHSSVQFWSHTIPLVLWFERVDHELLYLIQLSCEKIAAIELKSSCGLHDHHVFHRDTLWQSHYISFPCSFLLKSFELSVDLSFLIFKIFQATFEGALCLTWF